jgi:YVTN family beta-propeller protein
MRLTLPLIAIICATANLHATDDVWSITKRIHLGGDGGWDYVTADSGARRLYLSHGQHVIVLDLDNDKILASLDANGVHGIALAHDLNRGFISNGGAGTVTIFDLGALHPISTVKVGENPDAICYEPVTKRVFVFNGKSKTVSVIDGASGKVVGTIPLPDKPEFTVADGLGNVFDCMEDGDQMLKIDAAKQAIVQRWPLPAGSAPSALAIDAASHRLFVGCGNQTLEVMNADNGKIIKSLPIGQGVDATAFDPARHRVFASCRDGTLTVIDAKAGDEYSVEATVPTEKGARTMAVDSRTGDAYLPSATFGPPPPPTAEHPKPRPSILPDSLELLVVSHHQAL